MDILFERNDQQLDSSITPSLGDIVHHYQKSLLQNEESTETTVPKEDTCLIYQFTHSQYETKLRVMVTKGNRHLGNLHYSIRD